MTELHDVKFRDGTTSRVGTAWLKRWPEDIAEVDGEPFGEPTSGDGAEAAPPETDEATPALAADTPDPEGDPTEAAEAAEAPKPGRKRGAR